MRVPTPGELTLQAKGLLARGASRRPVSSLPLVGVINTTAGGWVLPLPEKEQMIVGRSAECDVTIADPSVSRRHLRVFVGDELAVEDLGSANGTTYDGQALTPHVRTTIGLGRPLDLGNSVTLFVHSARAIVAPGTAHTSVPPPPPADAVVHDEALRRVYALLPTIAPSPLSVLILGETGVGKEVFADAIHRASRRAGKPFLKLNCAALPESILEGELFGYERGAFSGAVTARPGLFEAADGGTVFLDEVGELPLQTQAKLLRVLESGEVLRLGSRAPLRVDVRFIAATNRDIDSAMRDGAFRVDLFYRLDGVRVEIPPLRSRHGDIVALATFFIARLASRMALPAPTLSAAGKDMLCDYAWPGNVRELRNVVERAFVMNPNAGELDAGHLLTHTLNPTRVTVRPDAERRPTATGLAAATAKVAATSLEEIEKNAVIDALEKSGGNQTAAARLLGIGRHALIGRMEAYGLARPRKKP
jgi:DNA-binding NtrC family response regulator